MQSGFRCVIHGSFRKHFGEIEHAYEVFTKAGIEVLAPKQGEIVSVQEGFALFEDELDQDPRFIELKYLHKLKRLGDNGFSFFVNPRGYIGVSASYELGVAQVTNTTCFFQEKFDDHPAYLHKNAVWSPEALADYITKHGTLPSAQIRKNERKLHDMWQELIVPGSVVAAGAIIEYQPTKSNMEKEILLVKTHKWGNRYSIVGGKVRRNERLDEALLREVREETGLSGEIGDHLCTFDQINNSGYHKVGVQHIFVDNIVRVNKKKVVLNEEAQEYVWATPSEALRFLDIEPNARVTLEHYQNRPLFD